MSALALLAQETPQFLPQNIAFGVIAVISIVAALKMVTTSNVVHAALYLVLVLASVAATYVLLAAEFVAATQILVYIGAVMVLMLFGVMLTPAQIGAGSVATMILPGRACGTPRAAQYS